MSTPDHRLIEELMAVDALGGLDAGDLQLLERERAAHGDCEECRRLESELSDTAGRLAFALDPEPVEPAMAERILAAGGRRPESDLPPAPAVDLAARRARRRREALALVAAAAVIALAVGAFDVAGRERDRTVAASASPEQQVVHFGPTTAGGQLTMAYTPGQPGIVLWGTDLPDPGADMTYEVWMVTGNEAVSGGCHRPTDGTLATYLNADVGSADLMAITVEPGTCPAAPTSQPILTATLSAS